MCHVCNGGGDHVTVRDSVHMCALCASIYRLTPAGSVMVYPKPEL
jgi:hypothetical protein